MRKRSSSRQLNTVELFPFLSVLVCTIGTLILLIIVSASQILNSQSEVALIAKSEDGKNQKKNPHYIECREDGIIIHPSQEFVASEDITNSGSALGQLILQVSSRKEQEYIIVAVRPDGFPVFRQVRTLLEKADIDIGFEPIDQGWKLKFKNSKLKTQNSKLISLK
ncbi:MAG: hypothetical protein F6J86_05450 [Symploca sp. SIO1B1]|nr:hypothetical protein [Symploca sp. SIO1A3]NER93270.1 hypothetical protein [Symploca sp. SIO1B1]